MKLISAQCQEEWFLYHVLLWRPLRRSLRGKASAFVEQDASSPLAHTHLPLPFLICMHCEAVGRVGAGHWLTPARWDPPLMCLFKCLCHLSESRPSKWQGSLTRLVLPVFRKRLLLFFISSFMMTIRGKLRGIGHICCYSPFLPNSSRSSPFFL